MKTFLVLLTLFCVGAFGQDQMTYSKVKVHVNQQEANDLIAKGITLDHGKRHFNQWIETDLSELELFWLDSLGVEYDILIDDVSDYYASQLSIKDRAYRSGDCGDASGPGFTPAVPENFMYGSMGGFYTYEEFLAQLDLMHTLYPELITAREPISDFETWEGRPIYWVRLSDNSEIDEEDEPEVLYTSIHHAREVLSLSQTIFYMWYLLENYGTNEEVTYVVDHTELYFIPMINPDGYIHNETTDPDGGGMHRKNMNPNIGTTNKGVDLNRNYGYKWNEAGTSPDENSDVFPGDSAFSEPETQAVKWFCENHEFLFASNAHTYSNLFLYPLGWTTTETAEDDAYFNAYTSLQAKYNGYVAQQGSSLYAVGGNSDDWMYLGDLEYRDAIFSITPEISEDSFWPPLADITPNCQEMVWSNNVIAHLPHVFGVTKDLSPGYLGETSGFFNYSFRRLGLTDGPMEISITPLEGIASIGELNTHTIALMETDLDSISFTLIDEIADGDEIKFVLNSYNGNWTKRDTIVKYFGLSDELFTDDLSSLDNWSGDWSLTEESYYSAETSITDSPGSDYETNASTEMRLNEVLSLTDATFARVEFYAKWEIENNYDYVTFSASIDGGATWTPLCGNYTNDGGEFQIEDKPLYDGNQEGWVLETVDLSSYLGNENVRLKFELVSDMFQNEDGFYVDDFKILSDGEMKSTVGIDAEGPKSALDYSVYPNPANNSIEISYEGAILPAEVKIYNHLGEEVITVPDRNTIVDVSSLSKGIYFIRFTASDGTSKSLRLCIN